MTRKARPRSEKMYEKTKDPVLNGAGRDAFEAVKMMEAFQKQPYAREWGSVSDRASWARTCCKSRG